MGIGSSFRPWGRLNWLLRRITVANSWSLLGCIGTEKRSLATFRQLSKSGQLGSYTMLRIKDSRSRHSDLCDVRLDERLVEFHADGGDDTRILDHGLNEEQWMIVEQLNSFLGSSSENVILDVTSLPKRFFFPFLRLAIQTASTSIKNLVVTYAIPKGYTKQPLAENFAEWSQLPLFSGGYAKERAKLLIVGVGFEAMGLQEQLETSESGRPTKFLLPFPAPVAAFQRSWELLRRLQQHHAGEGDDIYRVDVKDVSDTFDRLRSLTRNGNESADLAPFGPKPVSVGMAIFATITNSQVFYTQPTVYHPDYSHGISEVNGDLDVYAYAIRIHSQCLYQL